MLKVRELKDDYDRVAEYAQVKRDGWRILINRTDTGVVTVTTRKPKDVTALVRELPRAQKLWTTVNEACTLHAELWGEGVASTSVVSLLKASDPNLKLSVFGVDKPLLPASTITDASMWCAKMGLEFVPYFKRGTRDPRCLGHFTSLADLPKPYGDIEGYVFKDSCDPKGWQKYTEVKTVTLKIVGFNPGKGQHFGRVGSLICADQSGKVVCSAGGFTLLQRVALKDSDIGRAVEVAYKNIASNGKLRMPRFRRFRDDINPKEVDYVH